MTGPRAPEESAPEERTAAPSFASLRDRHQLTPIPGCPGRYIVRDAAQSSLEELIGAAVPVTHHISPRARDPVLVARLRGGGLISYQHPDGSHVHTLCDDAGFTRKLAQLGISIDP